MWVAFFSIQQPSNLKFRDNETVDKFGLSCRESTLRLDFAFYPYIPVISTLQYTASLVIPFLFSTLKAYTLINWTVQFNVFNSTILKFRQKQSFTLFEVQSSTFAWN